MADPLPLSFGARRQLDHDPAHVRAVLAAFGEAVREGRSRAECYRAAVAAWRRLHPGQSQAQAAEIAVCIIGDRVWARLTTRED